MKNYILFQKLSKAIFAIWIALCALWPSTGTAQVVQQVESFESTTLFPAPGWRQQKYATNVSGAFVLQPAATATNPTPGALALGGANLMMFNSFTGINNEPIYGNR